jgi:TOBE domain-containing protein
VRLLPPEEAGRPNTVAGKVEDATYTGAPVRYGVVAAGVRLAANLHDPRPARVYREGDPVALQLPADVHVLPGG